MYKILVLCVLFIVRVSSQSDNDDCKSYHEQIVTINKYKEPFWYQKKYGICVDGSSTPELPAYKLDFDKNYVKKILNFKMVTEINLEHIHLKKLPDIINLPSLKELSASNNNLTHVHTFLTGSPASVLILSINQIQSFDDNAISETVEELFLTCNNLSSLSPTWFKNPVKLKRLSLGGNRLSALSNNMFKDFINLKKLDLSHNQIVTLGSGSISGPTKIDNLYLSYNRIYEIKPDVFGPNIVIDYMDIQYNRLSFLHQGLMDKLKIRQLKIWGNPWQCPCKDIIHKWLKNNTNDFSVGIIRDEDPTCIYAETFSRHCVPFVDEKLYNDFVKTFEIYPIKLC